MSSHCDLVHQVVDQSAARFGDATALKRAGHPAGGITYHELQRKAGCAAGNLRTAGLRPRDRVILLLESRPEWLAAFFGILRSEMTVVPVVPNIDATRLTALIAHAQARGVVVSERTAALVPPMAGVTLLAVEALFAAAEPPPDETSCEVAVVAFTSGSTQHPRAVELTHRNLSGNLKSLLAVRHVTPADALLSVLPPAHMFELMGGQLGPLACGARIVYAGAPLPNRLIGALREEAITCAMAVPSLLNALYLEVHDQLIESGLVDGRRRHWPARHMARHLASDFRPRDLEDLRRRVHERVGPTFHAIIVGGAAIDPDVARVLSILGYQVDVGYGLTEAGPIVTLGNFADCPAGSVGRPIPRVEVALDEHGELLVRGDGVMRGYLNDPPATAATLAGGWLHTGDRARIDEAGYVFIQGRIKEAMVTWDGETVYPEEVEPYYLDAAFAELCVTGLPGDHGNDVPVLIVVPAEGASRELLEDSFRSLRARAPARCRVERMIPMDEPLPRTATGKVRRRALSQRLADGGRPA